MEFSAVTLEALQIGAQRFITGDRERIRHYRYLCLFFVTVSVGLFIYLLRSKAIGPDHVPTTFANLLAFLGSGIPVLPMMTLRNRVAGLEALIAIAALTPANSQEAERLKKMFFKMMSDALDVKKGWR